MRAFIDGVLNNFPFVAALICLGISQVLKMSYYYYHEKKIDFKHLVEAGGMPSSHSALVSGLATGVGLQSGWASPAFAMAIIFSSIVMYDAAGVRQAASKQARILNQMLAEGHFDGEKLQELIGHTPVEVFMGALLGIFLTLGLFRWFY